MKTSAFWNITCWLALASAVVIPEPLVPKFAVAKRWIGLDPHSPPEPKFFRKSSPSFKIEWTSRSIIQHNWTNITGRWTTVSADWILPHTVNTDTLVQRDEIHYDRQYFHEPLDSEEQYQGIKTLIQTYFATFRDLKVQTWLMHGSLLGWWWGKKVCRICHVSIYHCSNIY